MLELFVLNPPKSSSRSRSRARKSPFLRAPKRVAKARRNPARASLRKKVTPKRKSTTTTKRRTSVARRKPARRRVRRNVRRATPRRRVRRNAWPKAPIRHKRAAKKGWGRRRRRAVGYAPVKKRSKKRRTYRNYRSPGSVYNRGTRRNAILPYMAFNAPTKRRRKRRRTRRKTRYNAKRKRRRTRRNAILPFMAFNSNGGPMAILQKQLGHLTNVDFWTREILPLSAGFLGTGVVAGFARQTFDFIPSTGIGKHLTNIGSAMVLGAGAGIVTKMIGVRNASAVTARVFAGGLIYSLIGILRDLFGNTAAAKYMGLDGMGTWGLTNDLKHRISNSVVAGRGVSDFLTSQSLTADSVFMNDFATAQGIARAPHEGGLAAPIMDLDAVIHSGADAALI